MRVSPFRHLRITGYLLLPEAYARAISVSSFRSLPVFHIRLGSVTVLSQKTGVFLLQFRL